MAKNHFADLSLTSTDNTDLLGQSTQGTANANTIDSIFQKLGVIMALFYDQIGGVGTVAGTADAITLATNATYPFQSLATGLIVAFKAGSANTGAATINVDSLGAKKIRLPGDTALSAGHIVANGIYLLRYDAAYDSSSGAWVLLNREPVATAGSTTTAGVLEIATSAEFRTGSDTTRGLGVAETWGAAAEVTLTDAATIAVDLSTGLNFAVTLGGNRTLGNPTNEKVGQSGVIRIIQDGTGSRTLDYGSDWEFAGGTKPTLTTTASAQDLLFYHVIAADRVFGSLVKAIA